MSRPADHAQPTPGWSFAPNLADWLLALCLFGGHLPERVRLQMVAAAAKGSHDGTGVILNPGFLAGLIDGKGTGKSSIEKNFKEHGLIGTWFFQTEKARVGPGRSARYARYRLQYPVEYLTTKLNLKTGPTQPQNGADSTSRNTLNGKVVDSVVDSLVDPATLEPVIDATDLQKIMAAHGWAEKWARRCIAEIARNAKGGIANLPQYVARCVANDPERFKPTPQPRAFVEVTHQQATHAASVPVPPPAERGLRQGRRSIEDSPVAQSSIAAMRERLRHAS